MDPACEELLDRVRRFAMPAGAPQCGGSWLRQRGEMRFAGDRPWFRFEAEQRFEGDGIDFRWEARARMAPLLTAKVTDAFERGRGLLVARLLGVLPVARASGADTDRGEALRGLAELPWRPFAFREAGRLTWAAVGPGTLRGTYDDGRTRASVELEIDAEGRVTSCTAPDRPRRIGKRTVSTPWTGRFAAYRDFGPVRVPTRAEVAWALPDGPFTYWRAEVTDFGLLPPEPGRARSS